MELEQELPSTSRRSIIDIIIVIIIIMIIIIMIIIIISSSSSSKICLPLLLIIILRGRHARWREVARGDATGYQFARRGTVSCAGMLHGTIYV